MKESLPELLTRPLINLLRARGWYPAPTRRCGVRRDYGTFLHFKKDGNLIAVNSKKNLYFIINSEICGAKGGNFYTLLKTVEGLSHIEIADMYLAKSDPKTVFKTKNPISISIQKKEKMVIPNQNFLRARLSRTPIESTPIINYFIRRGLSASTLEKYKLRGTKNTCVFPLIGLDESGNWKIFTIQEFFLPPFQVRKKFLKDHKKYHSCIILEPKNIDSSRETAIICESPLDGLAYAELHNIVPYVIATSGQPTVAWWDGLPSILKKLEIKKVFLAFDNDVAGDRYTQQAVENGRIHAEIDAQVAMPPVKGRDWLDILALKNKKNLKND